MARKHPVFEVLDETAQAGVTPNAKALDRLNLPAGSRRGIEVTLERVARLRSDGEHQAARQLAHRSAGDLIDRLPNDQRRPDYLDEPVVTPDDPAELAGMVSRW